MKTILLFAAALSFFPSFAQAVDACPVRITPGFERPDFVQALAEHGFQVSDDPSVSVVLQEASWTMGIATASTQHPVRSHVHLTAWKGATRITQVNAHAAARLFFIRLRDAQVSSERAWQQATKQFLLRLDQLRPVLCPGNT